MFVVFVKVFVQMSGLPAMMFLVKTQTDKHSL